VSEWGSEGSGKGRGDPLFVSGEYKVSGMVSIVNRIYVAFVRFNKGSGASHHGDVDGGSGWSHNSRIRLYIQ
jgi:hypothetical protein